MSEPNPRPTSEVPAAPAESRVDNAFSRIKRRREEIRSKGHLDLLVPGYEGDLGVRYRDLNDKEHDQLAKRFERAKQADDQEGQRQAIANLLVAHCERIFVRRDDETEEWDVLEENGDPYRFDRRLAARLGLDSDKATEVVLDVFSPTDEGETKRCHPDAVAPHMEAIFAWRQGREDEINEVIKGEFTA